MASEARWAAEETRRAAAEEVAGSERPTARQTGKFTQRKHTVIIIMMIITTRAATNKQRTHKKHATPRLRLRVLGAVRGVERGAWSVKLVVTFSS